MSPDVRVRLLHEEDIPALVDVANSVGWPASADTWRWMLGLGQAFGAEEGGRLSGAALVFPYERAFGMLAMMMVRPERQRGGIGKALLDRTIAALPAGATMALYASDAGERLYRPNGFVDAGSSTRLEGRLERGAVGAGESGARVRAPATDDWPAIVALDARAQGAARRKLLASLLERGTRALVAERDGVPCGFGVAVIEDGALRLGPIVADDDDHAVLLASTLGAGAERVRIDLEPGETALLAWGLAAGLTVSVVSPRLVRGGLLPGERSRIRALAGRPFG